MAFNINGLIISSLEEIHAYNRQTGACELYLNELQQAEISGTEETQDITGKGNRLLKQIKRNKAVTVTGTSATISSDLLAAQVGGKADDDDREVVEHQGDPTKTIKVRRAEIIDVEKGATTATIKYDAVSDTEGAEIDGLFIQEDNGALGTSFTQGADATAETFKYDPENKEITLPTDIAKDGAVTIIVFYDYYPEEATTVHDYSDIFGKTMEVYIDALATDVCDKEYKVQFYFPRGQFSGEFTITLGGDQTVQNFTINSLVDTCAGADAKLFD